MKDLPLIGSSAYSSNTVALDNSWGMSTTNSVNAELPFATQWQALQADDSWRASIKERQREEQHQRKEENTKVTTRIVKVYIADPNENVPLEHRILYSGEEKPTDSTDQELFFEINIQQMLAEYNAKRVTFIDKKVKDRIEYLEPVKIRELKMTVVTIAQF